MMVGDSKTVPSSFQEFRQSTFEKLSPFFISCMAYWKQFPMLLQFMKRPENRSKLFTFRFKGTEANSSSEPLLYNLFDSSNQDRVTNNQSRLIEIISEPTMLNRLYQYLDEFMIKHTSQLWTSGVLSDSGDSHHRSGNPLLISLYSFDSLISSYLKLFRLSEQSGLLNLQFREESSNCGMSKPDLVQQQIRLLPLTPKGQELLQTIRSMHAVSSMKRIPRTNPPPESKKRRRSSQLSERQSAKNFTDIASMISSNFSDSDSSNFDEKRNRKQRRKAGSAGSTKTIFVSRMKSLSTVRDMTADHWYDQHPSIGSRVARISENQAADILRAKCGNSCQGRKRVKLRRSLPMEEAVTDLPISSEDFVRLKSGIVIGEIINCGRCPSFSTFKVSDSDHSEKVGDDALPNVYQVQWEDEKLLFLSQMEYENGLQFYDQYFGWRREGHESIGKQVAKYFYLPPTPSYEDEELDLGEEGDLFRNKETKKVFFGVVTKYAPPEQNDEVNMNCHSMGARSHEGELFHVIWDDGDHEDLDFNEYEQARSLFQSMKIIRQRQKPSPERKKQMLLSDVGRPGKENEVL